MTALDALSLFSQSSADPRVGSPFLSRAVTAHPTSHLRFALSQNPTNAQGRFMAKKSTKKSTPTQESASKKPPVEEIEEEELETSEASEVSEVEEDEEVAAETSEASEDLDEDEDEDEDDDWDDEDEEELEDEAAEADEDLDEDEDWDDEDEDEDEDGDLAAASHDPHEADHDHAHDDHGHGHDDHHEFDPMMHQAPWVAVVTLAASALFIVLMLVLKVSVHG